jgi:DDE superfamily endonuclease
VRSRRSKNFPARLDAIARAAGLDPSDVEVWFGDQARVGQKNKVTRRWARLARGSVRRSRMEWQAEGKRGTRPVAARDQRTASTYIFGAICPKEGKAVGLVLPRCNTEAMALHLAAISAEVAPGRHAALLVDQAGWHTSARLHVPNNITLVPLPAKCPELNAQENVWQFMRDNWLSNRIFTSYDDLVDHCCHAWNKLVDQPWRIMSLGLRDRAHEY